ncbi:MAG: restriction endonuclease subunit S [Bacteroidaceae bacterium]|nr:restriction endonuclease subunit S [Bacteroidaceae bacterium]
MEEWKEYKISEVIDEISMGPFGSNIKVDNFINFGVPVLNGSNLQGFKLNEDSFNYVSQEKADSLGKANAHKGDVVITHRGTLGQIVYIPEESKYEQYVISQSQFRLQLKQELIRPDFFVYFFHTRLGQHRILMNASQVGVPALARPTSTFKEVLVPVPPMKVQVKILSILKSLDDKIELNRKINANLEAQAQALFKSWFVDFEPFKDQPFVESELGMIPEGWRVGTLDEIGEIVGGSTPSKAKPEYYTEHGIAWLTPKDLSISNNKFTARGEIDITQEGYDSCSTKLMPQGSVLFSSRAPIGYITIAKNNICTNQGFKSIVPKLAGTAFIYHFLKTSTKEIENKATGSTFKEASGALMKSLQLIIAPQIVLDDFEEVIKPILREQEIIEDENSRLASLRDTLLPRLMSGELKVNEVI